MKSKKLLSLVLACMVVLPFAGCGNKANSGDKDAASKKMDKDQYINFNLGTEPKTLDLSKGNDLYAATILTETMEGLTRLESDKNGKDVIKPAGAKSWEHNEDATVWTFHLRDNEWSDGKKVTAKDYVYSVRRTLDPKTAAGYANLLYVIKNAEKANQGKAPLDSIGIKAVDDKTLQVTLERPCPYFEQITYNRVLLPQREDIVKKYGDTYGSDANKVMCCGPFVLTKWVHNSEVVLEKNDKYWDKKAVKLKKIDMKIISDTQAAYNSLYNGALDFGGVSKKEWIKKFDQTGKFYVIKGNKPSIDYIFFNTNDKLFKNANVRKAFSIGVTREDLCNIIFKGREKPAYGWVPPTVTVNGKDFRDSSKSPIKELQQENPDPKKLLEKGLKELGMNPDPSKLTVTFLQAGTDQWFRTYAEYLQQMYKRTLGINLKAEYVEWPVFQRRTDNGKFSIASMAMSGDYNDPNTFFDGFISTCPAIPTGWKNKEYDKYVLDAQINMDPKKRLEDYQKAEKIILHDDAAISPTAFGTRNTYVYKYVKDLMTPLFGTPELKYTYTDGRTK